MVQFPRFPIEGGFLVQRVSLSGSRIQGSGFKTGRVPYLVPGSWC